MLSNIVPSSHIQLKYAFGMNGELKNNLHYTNENNIIYPAGYQIVQYNTEDKSQTYFIGVEGCRRFSAMALSPLKRFLAVAGVGDPPMIIVYDTMSLKKKRAFKYHGESVIKEYIALAFAFGAEARILISLSGGPVEPLLIYWSWDKGKIIAQTRISQGLLDLYELAFNPGDVNFMSMVGKKTFKCYKLIEEVDQNNERTVALKVALSQVNSPVNVNQDYTTHCWLICDQKIIVCTEIGEILILDGTGDYQDILANSPYQNQLAKQAKSSQDVTYNIKIIIPYSKGFIIGCDNLEIYVYKHQEYNTYQQIQQFYIPSPQEYKEIEMMSLAITPNTEETLICSLPNNMIYQTKFKIDQNSFIEDKQYFDPLTLYFHSGTIYGMDLCVRKPLIATCGSDKCIRIWNYEEKTLETWSQFSEEAYSISIHPSGFHVAVGFREKLKLMNIIINNNQIKSYKEIPFKSCKEVKFSNGGQYFAAVNNQYIHVFNTYTGDQPTNFQFKGHTNPIKCLHWSRNDSMLVSCGGDQIYIWRVFQPSEGMQNRFGDFSTKPSKTTSVVLTADLHNILAVGSDRSIREYSISEKVESKKEVGATLNQICFSSSNKMLFAGIQEPLPKNANDPQPKFPGAIRCYKYPLSGQYFEYQAHDERGIEKMRVTSDDQYLISAGRDGCIMVFEIKDKEARGIKLKEGFSKWSEEILITKQEIEDLNSNFDQLKQTYNDTKNQSANLVSVTGKDDLIKQLEEKLISQAAQARKKHENLEEKVKETIQDNEASLNDLKQKFETQIQENDTTYQKKQLIIQVFCNNFGRFQEVAKIEELKKQKDMAAADYQKQLATQGEQQRQAIKKLELALLFIKQTVRNQSNNQLENERNNKLRIQNELEQNKQNFQKAIKLIDEETKTEISNLESKNQREINEIKEKELKLKSETSMTNKKIQAQQQESQELDEQKKEYQAKLDELKSTNKRLHEEIEKQLKMIYERDKIIGDKEKKIYDLKKRSQELEKFKFVLDHKIRELKRDIGPREDEILRMKDQTNQMDKKLKQFNTLNNTLGSVVDTLDQTQEEMKKKIQDKRQSISEQNCKIKYFKNAVYQAVQFIQNYEELKSHVERLYIKFVEQKDVKPPEINPEIKAEYVSQKKYLEKSVQMLKKNLAKDEEIHKQDNIRIMKDNVNLIQQINKLRKLTKELSAQQSSKDGDYSQLSPQIVELNKFKEIQSQQIINKQKQIQELQQQIDTLLAQQH